MNNLLCTEKYNDSFHVHLAKRLSIRKRDGTKSCYMATIDRPSYLSLGMINLDKGTGPEFKYPTPEDLERVHAAETTIAVLERGLAAAKKLRQAAINEAWERGTPVSLEDVVAGAQP